MNPAQPDMSGSSGRQVSRRFERPLTLASWGVFLIWASAVTHGGFGPGSVMAGAGVLIILHQAARRVLHFPPDGRYLLAGLLLIIAGAWRLLGAELRIFPLLLLTGGTALLILAWKEYSRGAGK